jgi:thymidylate synthase
MTEYGSLDHAFLDLLRLVCDCGSPVSPRKLDTTELIGVSFRLSNVRARLINNPARKWSLPLAIGEFCWHSRGADDLATLAYYSSAWTAFSADKKTVSGSCYGNRVFSSTLERPSQWESVRLQLERDPDSRRAVLYFGGELSRWSVDALDIPCATCAQFLIRDNKLNQIVTMRSNDIILGFGYDCFLFTMLQERMAIELGLEVGWYQHSVGSLHIYARHLDFAQRILQRGRGSYENAEMPAMSRIGDLGRFLEHEAAIRTLGFVTLPDPPINDYWQQLLTVLIDFRLGRRATVKKEPMVTDGIDPE